MIPKPSSCIGCPFYNHGDYFTPDTIIPRSQVMFIAQSPGKDEEAGHKLIKRHFHGGKHYTDEWTQTTPQPLIGATGQQFNNRFLPVAGLTRSEVSIGNAIRCRPGTSLGLKKADDLPNLTTKMKLERSDADIVKALNHCRDAHLVIPPSITTIVTMGRYAMFQLTGIQNEETEYKKKIGVMESWRGYGVDLLSYKHFTTVDTTMYHSMLSETRVFFMMHIAALNYGTNKRFMHATLQDFHRLRLLLDGQWPLPVPSWSTMPPAQWPHYSCFDTEYVSETNDLIRWSLCDVDNTIYCVENDGYTADTIPVADGAVILTQNALADIHHLSGLIDISQVKIEDMMLAHAILWPGEPHSMNYIASIYGPLNRHKHLNSDKPQLYSAMDAYVPMYMWQHYFLPAFKADPLSWRVYQRYMLPLIPIINKAQKHGGLLDSDRLTVIQSILQERLHHYAEKAKEITGDESFKLGGRKQMMEYIYD